MKYFVLFALMFAANLFAVDTAKDNRSHQVIVSIAPYKFFVEQIAGDTVKTNVFVPIGASFHDYEPTPKQVFTAGNSDIWFRVGESFENRAVQALQGHQLHTQFVDLRQGVNLIIVEPGSEGHCCCHADCADLHMWLSPKEVKIQAQTIAKALIEKYPEHKELYQKNLEKLLQSLDQLDKDISTELAPLKQRIIMVGHPAYAYFTRDYKLNQLSIEFEGKDPTPRQLTTILEKARQAHIKTIYTQKQYGSKAVQLVANELKANIVTLDPYSDDYFNMMRNISKTIATQN